MIKKIAFLSCAIAALAFIACGDENTARVTENYYDFISTLDSGKKLSKQKCDSTVMGKILFVVDSSEEFFCDGEEWISLRGSDGEKGDKGEKGAKGDTGAKGDKGPQGEKGDAGAPGSSGSVGSAGSDGKDGVDCNIVEDKAGKITVACGKDTVDLYRMTCGGEPYDNETHFCVNEVLYKSSDYFVDTRDMHVYRKITIGENKNAKTWMAENLNYRYNEGSAQSMCYGNNPDNCDKYGRLYTWAAAVDSAGVVSSKSCKGCGRYAAADENWVKMSGGKIQGVCPPSWHLPDSSEYFALLNEVSEGAKSYGLGGLSFANAGTGLKSKNDWVVSGGEDLVGFDAKPAGFSYGLGGGSSLGSMAYFLMAEEMNSYNAWILTLGEDDAAIIDHSSKDYFSSVRCVKD